VAGKGLSDVETGCYYRGQPRRRDTPPPAAHRTPRQETRLGRLIRRILTVLAGLVLLVVLSQWALRQISPRRPASRWRGAGAPAARPGDGVLHQPVEQGSLRREGGRGRRLGGPRGAGRAEDDGRR